MSVTFTAVKFTDATFVATCTDWRNVAGNDEFDSEYGPFIAWADANRNYDVPGAGSSLAYGLFENGTEIADAMIEVVSSGHPAGNLTKLLKVYISPKYWDVVKHRQTILGIFGDAIIETILLSARAQSRTVKIFGRSEELLSLLRTVHSQFEAMVPQPPVKSAIQGRWLEIRST